MKEERFDGLMHSSRLSKRRTFLFSPALEVDTADVEGNAVREISRRISEFQVLILKGERLL